MGPGGMKLLAGLLLASVATSTATASQMTVRSAANPIRKVVTMLQMMQKKVTEEGEKAEDLYEKFMCYCKTSGGDLSKSIEAAKTKIPDLESGVEESVSQKEQLDKDLVEHKADRKAAKKTMAEATEIRKKEQAAFDKESAEDKANLDALTKATAAITKGMGESFLQSHAAGKLRKFVTAKSDLSDADRQDLLAFLSASQGSDYAPASGQISGILKQMGDEMDSDLKELTEQEATAVADYEAAMAAKKKEVAALSRMIEEKLQRVGELGVQIQTMKNDLEDTKESLAEDQKFMADLEKNCKTKTAEWEEQKKLRAQEITALAETIKLLNDDDALDLFKKTLPSASASFMQVQVTTSMMKSRAMEMLRSLRRQSKPHRAQLDFISLALHGKKIGLDKIVKLIDDLVATLKAEQADDDKKKAYCAKELDVSDDKKKSLERQLSDLATVIEEAKEGIATLADEIAALETGIKALDKAVAEATDQRKKENEEYKELMANNGAAKEVILFAKNRLNKFYNPKMYKAPPKTEEAVAFVQLHAQAREQGQVAPPPPPEAMGAYAKKSEESGGVLQMMDTLVRELDVEMTAAETEEKNAQEDYEQTMKDSAEKRAQDAKSITDKEAAKSDLQGSLEKAKADRKSAKKELGATLQYIHSLHTECDWLLKYFDVRKDARTDEIDALGKAKDVLSGADYSFLQTGTRRAIRRRFLHQE